MKPAPFVHHRPGSLEEVVGLLADYAEGDVRILAGGQSLVPMMAFRLARPAHLVDINGVSSLRMLEIVDGSLRIGALTRHADFERQPLPGVLGSLLRKVQPHIAHHPIRTRGTFCGSIAHADPASEWCLVSATLDATMVAASQDGVRLISSADYFLGAMSTALRPTEILKAVYLPLLQPDTRFAFHEFARRAGDFAIAMALVAFELQGGCMRNVRIGIGGAEDRPRRITEAEASLDGAVPGPQVFSTAAELVHACLDPMTDATTDARYRRDLAATLTRRALQEAAA